MPPKSTRKLAHAKKSKSKGKGKGKNGENLWCIDDLNVDENGDLRIYNAYLCAVIYAAIQRAEDAGKSLKIICDSGSAPTKDANVQCTC